MREGLETMTHQEAERPGWFHRHRTATIAAAAVLAIAVVGGGTAYAMSGHGDDSAAAALPTAPASPTPTSGMTMKALPNGVPQSAIFADTCALTRTANDDPILYPGQAGVAMLHDFFGNTGVTAGSTAATLTGGGTNCTTSADASSYWTPVLYRNGQGLTPSKVLIYWRTPGRDAATTQTMPAGISMIAGDEQATAPQSRQVVTWQCYRDGTGTGAANTPRDCGSGEQVRLVMTFPSCWDGHTLDGAAQTNVVYPGKGDTCPADHPVRIPQVVLHETYPTSSAQNLTLSMGPGMAGSTDTAHADFVNGWTQATFDTAFATCVTGGKACGRVSGPDATPAHPDALVNPAKAKRQMSSAPARPTR